MINLRARQYEPMTMRFSQEDIIRGSVSDPISLNRYLYCHNNPLSFSDPTGMSIFSKLKSAAKSAVKAVKSTAKAVTAKAVSSVAKVTANVAKTVSKVSTAVAKASSTVAKAASKIAANSNSKLVKSLANGVAKTANKVTKTANKVTTVAKKVEKVSTQVAKACDKIATDSWNEAKTNFASAAKNFNDATKSLKQNNSCSISRITSDVKSSTASFGIAAIPTAINTVVYKRSTQHFTNAIIKDDRNYSESSDDSPWYKKVADAIYGAVSSWVSSNITGVGAIPYEIADSVLGTSSADTYIKKQETAETLCAMLFVDNWDWYYGGKVVGDLLGMATGVVEGIIGVKTIAAAIAGATIGAGFAIATSSTGVGTLIGLGGVAISGVLVLEGVCEIGVGLATFKYSYNRLGDDIDNFKQAVASNHTNINSYDIHTVNPYDLQPTHSQTLSNRQLLELMNEISENGITEPIKYVEYNGQMYVVDGHHRLIVAKKLGLTEVPVQRVDLPYKGYNTIEDLFYE